VSLLKAMEPAGVAAPASPDEAPGNSFELTQTEIASPRPVVGALIDEATLLREHSDAISKIRSEFRKKTIESACEIGRRLAVVKKVIGHGRWLRWLKAEFDWSDKTARNYIGVYEMVEGKLENVSNLNLTLMVLYLIKAPSTPQEVRDEVLEQAKSGKPVTVAGVKAQIASAKSAPAVKMAITSPCDPVIAKRSARAAVNEEPAPPPEDPSWQQIEAGVAAWLAKLPSLAAREEICRRAIASLEVA
jgi:hypothetical protein